MDIRPTLEYACAFWNGAASTNKQVLNKIQKIIYL